MAVGERRGGAAARIEASLQAGVVGERGGAVGQPDLHAAARPRLGAAVRPWLSAAARLPLPSREKAILETGPVLRKAVERVYASLSPPNTMVVADLGCSSGPNTLLFVSQVMSAISGFTREKGDLSAVELQFFLNDLPSNDFNILFRSLDELRYLTTQETATLPVCYVAGLPGSFYTRLFPSQSVHVFHSSYCLHWRSKVPEGLSSGATLNEQNVYIGKTSPPSVVKLFQEQFQKDFELFLALRYRELVYGGRMVLTFLGRKSNEISMHGEVGNVFELLAEALQSLVQKVGGT